MLMQFVYLWGFIFPTTTLGNIMEKTHIEMICVRFTATSYMLLMERVSIEFLALIYIVCNVKSRMNEYTHLNLMINQASV